MSFRRKTEINMDLLAEFLQNAVEKVKTEENPDLLNDIKKVYKKNVPFSLRMYVAAYLAKQCAMHYRPKRDYSDSHRIRDYKKDSYKSSYKHESSKSLDSFEPKPAHEKTVIDESLATTIFIGIGRNRRVYPRDLVGILISVAGLERDRIGDIRVLANYSFVQLFTEDAQKAIDALNGYDYRGRKLSVSFSRTKDGIEENFDSAASYDSSDVNASASDANVNANANASNANVSGTSDALNASGLNSSSASSGENNFQNAGGASQNIESTSTQNFLV